MVENLLVYTLKIYAYNVHLTKSSKVDVKTCVRACPSVRACVREKRKRRLPSSSSLMMIGLLILGLCKQGIYAYYKGQTGCMSSG